MNIRLIIIHSVKRKCKKCKNTNRKFIKKQYRKYYMFYNVVPVSVSQTMEVDRESNMIHINFSYNNREE